MPARIIVALLLPMLLILGCGVRDDQSLSEPARSRTSAVVGGEPALPSEYPSTVALVEGSTGEPFCTGTLIAPNAVLTAAHCLLDLTIADWARAVIGYADPATAPAVARRSIAKSVYHSDFSDYVLVDSDGLGLHNDIGILVLKDPVPHALVTPILPLADYDAALPDWTPSSQQDVDIVGYGIYDLNGEETGRLHKGRTPHIRHLETEMLAGRPGEPGSCQGDSGGPAYLVRDCSLWLVGVTSRARVGSDADCGEGTIYTVPAAYLSWIEGELGAALPVPDPDAGGLASGVCEDDAGVVDASVETAPEVSREETGDDAADVLEARLEEEGSDVRPESGAALAADEGSGGESCACSIPAERRGGVASALLGLVALGGALRRQTRRPAPNVKASPSSPHQQAPYRLGSGSPLL